MTTLPPRLAAVAGRVLPGFPAADIGSDHALLAAYLLESGICPRVIATDVGVLPLERARDAMTACQAPEYDCRLGFGLSVIGPGEVATVIIAGMGGRNIADILAEDLGKLQGFRRLILQPMNRFPSLLTFWRNTGFRCSMKKWCGTAEACSWW
jgi:tRNA (adenine22-N1)-methyltransferase